VGLTLVDEVITIMGQPEDYLVDDEIFEDEPGPKQKKTRPSEPSKKLYRDTDNSYIGGVAAGLSHYLGINTIWVRLLWLLFAVLSGGSFVLIYFVFWALIPEATTTAEKLTMTGEPVNISNIERKIKDGIDVVSEKVKNVDFKKHSDNLKDGFETVADNISETVKGVGFEKQSKRLKSTSQNFFESIGTVILFCLKVFAKFFGVLLIVIGISTLLGLIIAFFTVGVTNASHFPPMNFIDAANAANIPIWLMSLTLFLAIGIPFFFVFYIGLKILVNNLKSIGNVAKFTLLGLWVFAILSLVVMGIRQATEHAFDAEVISKKELNIKANDTLKISMSGFDRYDNYYYKNHNNFRLIEDDNGRSIVSSDIKLIVNSTTDSIAKITILKEASGSNYGSAKKRAENINYDYSFSNNELQLEAYHSTDAKNKYSDQEVRIIVYLPEGAILYTDQNTIKYQRSSYNNYNSITTNHKDGHYLKVIKNDLECLDCADKNSEPVSGSSNGNTSFQFSEKEGITIKSDDSVKLRINEDGINVNGNKINVKINDKDGVKITTDTKKN
jgi:phage shock protein PspC (stress-responsive transcriptional regulator)